MPAPSPTDILKDLLDPFDVEDLVFVYLQCERGYLVLPASRRTNTAAYEYVLVNPDTRQQAIVQIRTGDAPVPLDELLSGANTIHKAFAYSARGLYDGDQEGRVERLTDDELLRFALERPYALPPRVYEWLQDHAS